MAFIQVNSRSFVFQEKCHQVNSVVNVLQNTSRQIYTTMNAIAIYMQLHANLIHDTFKRRFCQYHILRKRIFAKIQRDHDSSFVANEQILKTVILFAKYQLIDDIQYYKYLNKYLHELYRSRQFFSQKKCMQNQLFKLCNKNILKGQLFCTI